jgi:hypothetical protein
MITNAFLATLPEKGCDDKDSTSAKTGSGTSGID